MRSAIGSLEKADKSKNPVGQSFELGKTFVMWLAQPNMPVVTTRGAVGFTQNATQPLDLVVAIDSAFGVVEKAMPECVGQTNAWRAQKGWVTMINSAIAQLNAEHADSAELLAKRSLVLNPNAPYGYMVLGNLAQKKSQPRQAIDYFKQTVEKSGTDTTYGDLKRQTLLAAANLAADAAESATGPEKAAYLSGGMRRSPRTQRRAISRTRRAADWPVSRRQVAIRRRCARRTHNSFQTRARTAFSNC